MQLHKRKTFRWTIALAGLLSLGLLSQATVLAGQTKVDVCHLEGNGEYHLINIAEPAYQTHVDHGDAKVGEPVPGKGWLVFAEDCSMELACPCSYDSGTPRFSSFLESVTNEIHCIDINESGSVNILLADPEEGEFVAATDTGANGEGACGYYNWSESVIQELYPITVEEGIACLYLLSDVAEAAALPYCI